MGGEIAESLRRRPPRGSLARRVTAVFRRALDAARDQPRLAEAVFTSATSSDPEAVRAQARFTMLVPACLDTVLDGEGRPKRRELETLMGHVFFSAVVNMATGRITYAEAVHVVETAAQLCFTAHPERGVPR